MESLNFISLLWTSLAVLVFYILFRVSAPYGRHNRKGWGPVIPNRWGWFLMESPTVFLMIYFFLSADFHPVSLIFLLIWLSHYFYRVFLYPLTLRTKNKDIPLLVAGLAFFFNIVNVNLNGRTIFYHKSYSIHWITDIRFLIGLLLFITGYIINKHSDRILRQLRKPDESGYHIPRGGLYKWISCPNYFGEIIEWTGWAVATWSIAGLSFAVWTVANLAPRAKNHHQWYQEHFLNYPRERKALLPGLW